MCILLENKKFIMQEKEHTGRVQNTLFKAIIVAHWVFAFNFLRNIPMWTECNSKTLVTPIKCETIILRPTRTEIVWKAMLKSKQFSDECGSQYGSVIYDLKIEKDDEQIQSEERPTLILFFCHVWRVLYATKPILSKF